MSSVDLVEFLRARLDEDEERAKAPPPDWDGDDELDTIEAAMNRYNSSLHTLQCGYDVKEMGRDCECGVPARVLAECDAKRKIIDLHVGEWECPVCAGEETEDDDSDGNRTWSRSAVTAPCATLRTLALPYADHHPDYDEAWRP